MSNASSATAIFTIRLSKLVAADAVGDTVNP